MKAPSRKTITASIFFAFFILFFGGLFWYFGSIFFTSNDSNFVDTDESRGFTFFPFGRGGSGGGATVSTNQGSNTGGVSNGQDEVDVTGGEFEQEIIIDRLRLVAEVPTAGGVVYRRPVESSSLFNTTPETEEAMRFIEVESGHVYETTENTLNNVRITNTTIPRIAEAEFINGDSVVVRYIDPVSDAIKTFSARVSEKVITPTEGDIEQLQKLNGIFLPDDIQDISINSRGEILYTQTSQSGLVAITTDTLGQNKKQIFSSPLREWIPDWSRREETITLTQYPSTIAFGFSQILNRTTERTAPFVSGRRALGVLLSPDGTRALVSYKTGRTISLFVRTEGGELVDTGLDTYAEKCVWSGDSVLAYCAEPINQISNDAPDVWYQGLETYADDVWRINTDDVTTRELFSPFEEGLYSIDIIDLDISADERFLYFRDKQNLFFWTYQLEV